MVRHGLPVLAWMLATVVLGLGSSAAGTAGEGHGAGAGHVLRDFHGGWYGPGFRGYYRYPGWCGVGLGFGVGYGYWYGYPYYPYYPYGYDYPIYVAPIAGPPPNAYPPAGWSAGQGPAPVPSGSPAGAAPVRFSDTDVLLSIRVPPDAVVRINGVPTTQNGPRREFVSSGLVPGRTYTFVVTARWTGPNGQAVELERRLSVQGGERRHVDFFLPSPQSQNELLR